MNKIKEVVYGLGGFDESKPDNNLVEIIYYTDEELLAIEAEKQATATKQAILDRLDLTEEELRIVLG